MLVRVDLNVPMENGKVTDATRIERVAPTITEIADKGGKVILLAHFGRPKGRDPKESLKPVAAEVAQASSAGRSRFADDCIGREGRGRGRRDEARRHPLPGEHPLPQGRGEERSGVRRGARAARRPLGQRRLLRRAPRARLDRRPRPQAAGLCRPHHAGRARSAGEGAGSAAAAGGRDRRRRQGLHQARPARQPDRQGRRADHRRRAWPTRSSPRRASRSASRWPRTTCSTPRARSWPRPRRQSCEIVLPVDAVVAQKFEANAPSRAVGGRRGRRRRHDPRHRPAQHRARRLGARRGSRRWSGTARSAPSRWSRSTPAPSRWPRRRRN